MAARNIDEYLKDFTDEHLNRLLTIRRLGHEMVPEAGESMAYGVPTIVYKGKSLYHFAGMKKHLGFYPTSKPIEHFHKKLADYKISRGTIQLPWNQSLPLQLVKDIIEFRIHQVDNLS